MPRLVACPHCQSHTHASDSRCSHCNGALRTHGGRLAATAAAALLGLAPMACEKGGPDPASPSDGVAEPEYGVPETPSDEGGVAEPEYGVPDTDLPASPQPKTDPPQPDPEPEYGVPASDLE